MNKELAKIIEEHTDLYNVLGIQVDAADHLPSSVTITDIKRHYRSSALIYHPDKHSGEENAKEFHELLRAANILTDEELRKEYDAWLTDWLQEVAISKEQDESRTQLANKLQEREKLAHQRSSLDHDEINKISNVQKYGQTLRKFKHFNIPYGDWQNLQASSNVPKYPESSTLRLEIVRDTNLSKAQLKSYLQDIWQTRELDDLYYSSRNNYVDDPTIVVYAVLSNPEKAVSIYKMWQRQDQGCKNWGRIKDISPRIPVQYYTEFTWEVPLNPHLAKLVNNELVEIG